MEVKNSRSEQNLMESLKALLNVDKSNDFPNVDEDGFVVVAKESTWPSLFGSYYMGISYEDEFITTKTNQHEDDDMLFYVQIKPGDSGQEIKVFRKTSKNLPGLGDPHINWEESVYLNMIMHHLEYSLTCSICARLPTHDLKVLYKKTLNVHASHHMRRMDSKGETSDQSYPNIFFIIDSYDEVFESMSIQENEIVCVELSARYKGTKDYVVIFLGSVRHEALLATYDAKTTIGTKFAQKMSWIKGPSEHFEYIRMRGPHGKGFAEMRIGLCGDDLVEHNGINKHRQNSDLKSREQCQCKPSDNQQIYAPTTTSPDTCMRCARSTNTNSNSKMWSNTVKWLQGRSKSSTTLIPHLTYVTLPWSRIMKDILQVRQKPVFLKESNK